MKAAWLLLLAACCTLSCVCWGQQDTDSSAAASPASAAAPAALPPAPNLPLNSITLPPGFSISLYVDATFPARFFALGKADGNATVVFVSSTKGKVSQRWQQPSTNLRPRCPGYDTAKALRATLRHGYPDQRPSHGNEITTAVPTTARR